MRLRYTVLLAVVLLAGMAMRTNASHRRQQILREAADLVGAVDRFVDVGVRLIVVRKDPRGLETDPAKLDVVREHPPVGAFGGIIDTRAATPRIVAPSANPQRWYCSEDQEPVVLHSDASPPGKLALGGMGAGKTTAGAIWLYFRWLEHVGTREEGGITAPTNTRIDLVLRELFNLFPKAWYRYSSSRQIMTMCDGTLLRAVSTQKQSAAQGTRIAGFNWSWWLGDEMQDQIEESIHIIARLRSDEHGRGKSLATATAKDSSSWRTWRNSLSDVDWLVHEMLGPHSPFIANEHWAKMRRSTTDRNYRRLVLAEDLPSEGRVYFGWDRSTCLRPIPVTARKITSIVLQKKTGDARHALLAGHDPGSLKGATIYLDAYQVPGTPDPVWWVRGETLHKRQTTQRSARDVLAFAKAQGLNGRRGDGPIVHVRAMPVGQAEDNPSEDLYRIFRAEGLDVRASQYRKDGTGTGVIKKEDRIELVNWLFESGRLFIECDDRKRPVASSLIAALEAMERDHRGKAESGPKDETDLSDCPAALGYAVWPFEKSASAALRLDVRNGIGVG